MCLWVLRFMYNMFRNIDHMHYYYYIKKNTYVRQVRPVARRDERIGTKVKTGDFPLDWTIIIWRTLIIYSRPSVFIILGKLCFILTNIIRIADVPYWYLHCTVLILFMGNAAAIKVRTGLERQFFQRYWKLFAYKCILLAAHGTYLVL